MSVAPCLFLFLSFVFICFRCKLLDNRENRTRTSTSTSIRTRKQHTIQRTLLAFLCVCGNGKFSVKERESEEEHDDGEQSQNKRKQRLVDEAIHIKRHVGHSPFKATKRSSERPDGCRVDVVERTATRPGHEALWSGHDGVPFT